MAQPLTLDQLTAVGTLNAAAAIAVAQGGATLKATPAEVTLAGIELVTRSAGTIAAGSSDLNHISNTFTGHSGGTTDVAGFRVTNTSDGANAVTSAYAGRFTGKTIGAGALTQMVGVVAECRLDGAGDVGTPSALIAQIILTSTGSATNAAAGLRVAAPTITSSGTIPFMTGLHISNQGHANVTIAVGIRIIDQASAVSAMEGIRSEVSAGSGKLNINASGTAANFFAGVTGIVQTPTDSTCLALAASTTSRSSVRLPHGVAPSAPVNGDMWTTTGALFVRVNGVTEEVAFV